MVPVSFHIAQSGVIYYDTMRLWVNQHFQASLQDIQLNR